MEPSEHASVPAQTMDPRQAYQYLTSSDYLALNRAPPLRTSSPPKQVPTRKCRYPFLFQGRQIPAGMKQNFPCAGIRQTIELMAWLAIFLFGVDRGGLLGGIIGFIVGFVVAVFVTATWQIYGLMPKRDKVVANNADEDEEMGMSPRGDLPREKIGSGGSR